MNRVLARIASRYFDYRDEYVAHFRDRFPERLGWALASEVARLSFTLFCALLCVLIFTVLTAEAAQLDGRRGWALPFGALAAFSIWASALTGRALGIAVRESSAYRRELLKK